MRLIPLEIGRLHTDLQSLTGEPGTIALPIPSWLIEHDRGLAMFDTGMHTELRTGTERIGPWASKVFEPDLPDGEDVTARLGQHGIDPADIDLVIFSHLHFDHCGGTVEVPNARIVVQRQEWAAGHHPKLIEHHVYNPDDFDLGHEVQQIDGEHDVFGDGSVVCLPTAGHTRGHQSLRLELASGPVVLTGDCVYFERFLDDMTVPQFGYDLDQQRDSMRELARLRSEGCRLLYGHDAGQFASLPAEGLT